MLGKTGFMSSHPPRGNDAQAFGREAVETSGSAGAALFSTLFTSKIAVGSPHSAESAIFFFGLPFPLLASLFHLH